MRSPTQHFLLKTIDEIRKADYDYVITFFSGHGAEAVSGTILVINGEGETIEIEDSNLSQRQLLIFDCCRVCVDDDFLEEGATMFSMSRDPIRKAYEERIQDSMPQEIILFACDEGEIATETSKGGRYVQSLLDATKRILDDSHSPFVRVSSAHYRAASLIRQKPSLFRQRPQLVQSPCPRSQRLPWAVNPNFV